MNSTILFAFVFAFLFFSCTPKIVETGSATAYRGPVRFDQLQIGQRSRYLSFRCLSNKDTDSKWIEYQGDTLVMEISGADRSAFIVREYLTPGSNTLHDDESGLEAGKVYRYRLWADDDSLSVGPLHGERAVRSRLFSGLSQPLPLAPCFGALRIALTWRLDLKGQVQTACIADHHQLGRLYALLNAHQDTRRVGGDGPGFLYAYSGESGLVRCSKFHYSRSAPQLNGHGWDLIPE